MQVPIWEWSQRAALCKNISQASVILLMETSPATKSRGRTEWPNFVASKQISRVVFDSAPSGNHSWLYMTAKCARRRNSFQSCEMEVGICSLKEDIKGCSPHGWLQLHLSFLLKPAASCCHRNTKDLEKMLLKQKCKHSLWQIWKMDFANIKFVVCFRRGK